MSSFLESSKPGSYHSFSLYKNYRHETALIMMVVAARVGLYMVATVIIYTVSSHAADNKRFEDISENVAFTCYLEALLVFL